MLHLIFKVDVYGRSLDDSSDSHARVKDTHVYSLLFTECDSDQSGWANVDDLILYIKKVLSSSSEVNLGADETDGSDGSVSFIVSACVACNVAAIHVNYSGIVDPFASVK